MKPHRAYRILLINPPYERLKGLSVESMPLGLLSLATVLAEAGHEVKVYDADTSFEPGRFDYDNLHRAKSQSLYLANLGNDDFAAWREMRALLKEYHPDIAGVTMMSPAHSSCRRVFRIIKETIPAALLVAGGPHVTICKERVLKDNPEIDFAFTGEAEEGFCEFLESLASGRNLGRVKGVLYRDQGQILYTGERDFIRDLDTLPIPRRELLHNEARYRPAKLTQMVTSRGCPFECTFCASVPLWRRKVRRRSPQRLIEEIEYLTARYRIRSFEFWDDTFTTSKKDVLEFCGLLSSRFKRRKPVWKCITNINCLDDEMLGALKAAGCRTINIGIESGSDRVLAEIKKRITTGQAREAVKKLRENGFLINAFFMVGMPQETVEDIRKTISFMKELCPDNVNLCTFTPYVGTELYERAVKGGFLKDGDFSVYDTVGHHSTYNFFVEGLGRQEYQSLLEEALEVATAISKKKTLRKFILKLRGLTLEKVRYRLKQVFGPTRG